MSDLRWHSDDDIAEHHRAVECGDELYLPSPVHIADHTAEISSGWSPPERRRRRVAPEEVWAPSDYSLSELIALGDEP